MLYAVCAAHSICPMILQFMYYSKLQIDMETGVGLLTGGAQDTDPQLMLRWSDDGGHKWSNEHWQSAGKRGAYRWRLCGVGLAGQGIEYLNWS